MKVRFYPVVLSLVCACVLPQAPVLAAAESAAVFVDPADPSAAAFRQQGERVIDQVGGSMMSELRKVLASTPTALALGAVHLKDFKLPDSPRGKPVVTAVRRTSLQIRSSANAPDDADRAALDHIKAAIDRGDEVDKVVVQKITTPGRPDEWRIYRPLAVVKQCVDCHGPRSSIAPDVLAQLQKLYPNDEAADYAPGSWRGVIRVSLTEPKSKR